ncbi:hypothetical protein [Halonotius sp. GCM10025705]|uniref:hypothetical protein n=1 Tax=Halonotius sp. GCM10025705 TaxID=3252678 RepID=UPI003614CCAE
MGTLVIDIETASPFEEPPENSNDTQYFELFAVSLAYADEVNNMPETEVLFRRGNWDEQYTIDLYERLFDWCDQRNVDRLLTYNGTWFDGKHLLNWARDTDESGSRNFSARIETLFENHVDVALAAADEYESGSGTISTSSLTGKSTTSPGSKTTASGTTTTTSPTPISLRSKGKLCKASTSGRLSARNTCKTSKQVSNIPAFTANLHNYSTTTV